MERGSDLPWLRMNAFVEEIGGAGDDRELIRGVTHGLDRLIGMDLPCVFALISPEGSLVAERTEVPSRLWFDRFRNHYWNRMPDLGAGQDAPSAVVDWNRHLGTEYAADFMRPQHIRYSLGVMRIGEGTGGYRGTLAINRSSSSSPFTERDRRLLEALQPHISNFYRILLRQALAAPAGNGPDGMLRDRGITERELQIAGLVISGLSNEEIARRLGISERTVEAHCVHIYNKLGLRNRRELIILAAARTGPPPRG